MSDPETRQPDEQAPLWPPLPPANPAPGNVPEVTPPLWQSESTPTPPADSRPPNPTPKFTSSEWGSEPLEAFDVVSFCPTCGKPWQREWLACPQCELGNSQSQRAASASPAPPINLGGPLALYFILLGSLLVVFAVASEDVKATMDAITAFDIGSAILVLFWAAVVGTQGMGPIKLLVPARWLLGMFPAAIGTFLFAVLSMAALTYAFDIPEEGITDLFFEAGYGWTAVILLVCLQPAVIEELAFRGVILHGLRTAMSDRDAIIVSSLMFAILHLNMLGIPYLFVVGAAAGWIRIKSGSLLPCMLLHFCHNFLVIAQEAGWLGF